jgi:hypothetical protein
MLAPARIDDDEPAIVGCLELRVGVQKLDSIDGAVGCDIDVDLIGKPDRLDGLPFLAQPQVRDVVGRIISQSHGMVPFAKDQKNLTSTVMTSQAPSSCAAYASTCLVGYTLPRH